ncbi:MAG TPA: hypothetical protein VFU75_00765 [Gemmatimonadales bacterium]|nr:hypothetical protein [Gemmatimonadales bacterium]
MAGELITREALDRIIQRAAELQTGERDIGDGLTEAEVVKLGGEVGIPARYLQQALLEERTRTAVTEATGTLAWLFGPGQIWVERVVPGSRADVEQSLTRWMEDEELLQVKRRFADRMSWEPRVGAFASIQRVFSTGGRGYALARAEEIHAQVTQLEPGFCHVRLGAVVANLRRRRVAGGSAIGGTGALMTGAMMVVGAFGVFALAPLAVLVPVGIAFARAHGRENERVQVSLEQVLDRLERSEIRADRRLANPSLGPVERIADEIRKTFQGWGT